MGKKLTVILGAGASYDLVATQVGWIQPNYTPPLTAELFQARTEFSDILKKYPGAMSLGATIATRIKQGQSLEDVLRSMLDRGEDHVIPRLGQVPFYLQHLLGEISEQYTAVPVNYSRLITDILGPEYDKVALVTLNYDLFLEKSLAAIERKPVTSLDSFAEPDRKWMLVKLHGSVNWGRRVEGAVSNIHDQGNMLKFASEIRIKEGPPNEIYVQNAHNDRWLGDQLLYPVMAMPLAGKYDHMCPEDHVDALKEFLGSCPNYLIIGVSGKDDDLLNLLFENVDRCEQAAIVGGAHVDEVYDRIAETFLQIRGAQRELRHDGFSSFITTVQLDDFLSRLVS